jgi:hypothetical protein
MNDTIKLIVGLLEGGKPELQIAAAQVLGELRPKESGVLRALLGAQRRSPVLGRFCLEAMAKIASAEALEAMAQNLVDGDALAEHAAHLLAEAGSAAHPVLVGRFPAAEGDGARRILNVLSRQPGKEAVPVFVRALLTPDLSAHAARLLSAANAAPAPNFGKLLREALQKHLDDSLPEVCLANVIAVLARLDAEGSKALLVKCAQAPHSALVRSAAFRALRGTALTAVQLRTMLDLLEDANEKDVHDAVREVLSSLPEVPEGALPVMKRLLAARQPEQRLFALRMLRTSGGVELAKFALKWLDHEDERFRQAAADALSHNKQASELVLRLLVTTRHPALADAAAGVLLRQVENLSPKFVQSLAEKAIKSLATNVRLADQLLDVVLASSEVKLVSSLVEAAVRMRRAGRRGEALHLLARTASRHPGDAEVRYQLALTKLLADAVATSDANAETSAPGNPTMGFFAALVRDGFPLFERLRKENSATPELLLRIATHFSNGVGPERRFGTELLQHLATRTRGRAGDEAKVALRAVGV